MKRRNLSLAGLSVLLVVVTAPANDPPHLAMGFRAGEVTRNSAIVWTRLTLRPSRNETGTKIMGPAGPKQTHSDPMLAEIVDQLHGAVPGCAGQLRLLYSTNRELEGFEATEWVDADASSDYTRQFSLTNLSSGTVYYLRVEARSTGSSKSVPSEIGSFTTPAPSGEWQDVRFTVVTGQAYKDLDHSAGFHIYPAMAQLSPHFLIPTGDTVYYDSEAPRARSVPLARYHWQRMYSLPRLVDFHRHVPGYWEKDDHDTLSDDCWPTKKVEWMLPLTFGQGQSLFREQNPMGNGPTYRTFRWGKGLQIWLTEGRDFRSPNNAPDGPEKTIWGKEQLDWLRDSISSSDANFRVLISPTPIVGPDRSSKQDNHSNSNFAHEGNLFRNWTKSQGLKNFYVCCGDRHWQYRSIDPATGLREFSCGPASDEHAGGSPGIDDKYQPFHRVAGGFLSVHVTNQDDPTITFRFHDVHGQIVHEYIDRGR